MASEMSVFDLFENHTTLGQLHLRGFPSKYSSYNQQKEYELTRDFPQTTHLEESHIGRLLKRVRAFQGPHGHFDYSYLGDVVVLKSIEMAPNSIHPLALNKCFKCDKKCDLFECGRCHAVKYCGKRCQLLDWKFHKKVCRPAIAKKATMLRLLKYDDIEELNLVGDWLQGWILVETNEDSEKKIKELHKKGVYDFSFVFEKNK